MVPAGYMLKKVIERPDSLQATGVRDIYSLSSCLSENFSDYVKYWKHNGYWLFNSPATMKEIAAAEGIDLSGMTLFYYEVFPEQFDESSRQWSAFEVEPSFLTAVERPASSELAGYDVTTFSAGNGSECSPLSCNGLAKVLGCNSHCLFLTFKQAKAALEAGCFDHCEPGPFRIFAVHTVGKRKRSIRPFKQQRRHRSAISRH